MTKRRKADLIMHYIPQIRQDDIADIYVNGMKLLSVKLGGIDCSFETAEVRELGAPGVFEIKVPADPVPKCTIQIEGTLQSNMEITEK